MATQSEAVYRGYDELEARILAFMGEDVSPDDAASDHVFNGLALDIFRYQLLHNQPLGNFARLRKAEFPGHWTEIPALPTEAFKLDDFPLRSFPKEETGLVFHTSGTTGESPGRHYFKSPDLYLASVSRGWARFRAGSGMADLAKLVIAPSPEQAPHSSLSAMMHILGGRFLLHGASELDLHSLRESVGEGSPVILMGTALALLHLAERERIPLPDGSWLMETGGYKGTGLTWTKEELYAKFCSAFGLPVSRILNEYGMTELSSQFYATGLAGLHSGPPWIRARVIDPETGAEVAPGCQGHLQFCDLANLGSAIAIRTSDLAIRRERGSFQLLGRDPMALPRGCSRSADEMLRPPPGSIFQSFDYQKNAGHNR